MTTAQEVINNLSKISKARFIYKTEKGDWYVVSSKPLLINYWVCSYDCSLLCLPNYFFDIEDVHWKDSLFEAQD